MKDSILWRCQFSPTWMYGFQKILIKISAAFVQVRVSVCVGVFLWTPVKVTGNCEGPSIVLVVLNRKNKSGGLLLQASWSYMKPAKHFVICPNLLCLVYCILFSVPHGDHNAFVYIFLLGSGNFLLSLLLSLLLTVVLGL